MNTMTLFPSQYVEEVSVARPAATVVDARRSGAGLSKRMVPVGQVLAAAAAYALFHLSLLAMGIAAELSTGIGVLSLAVIFLALSIERYGAILSILATANLAVTVALVHPELAATPMLAAAFQLLMVLALVGSEVLASYMAAVALRRADLGLLEGSV